MVDPSDSMKERWCCPAILMERAAVWPQKQEQALRQKGDLTFDEATLDTEGQLPAEPQRVYPSRSMALNLRKARIACRIDSRGRAAFSDSYR